MGRSLRLGVAVVLTLAVLLSFRTFNGVDAGASLLVAMAALKLMETRRQRDWQIVLGAALFLLLAACLDAQSLWRMPLYAGELWLLCTAMYALGAGSHVPAATALARNSGRGLLLALPFAILLFLCFPRLSGSFWSVPREDKAVTGLGEEMSPGSISELSNPTNQRCACVLTVHCRRWRSVTGAGRYCTSSMATPGIARREIRAARQPRSSWGTATPTRSRSSPTRTAY